jgi:hypothetical protein
MGHVPSWAPRRASRDPDIHSGLVGAVFLRIGLRSCVVQTGLLEGWYPSQRRAGASRTRTPRVTSGVGWPCATQHTPTRDHAS